MVGRSVDSGCHKLSENIWFVWSKRSYNGRKGRMSSLYTDGRMECEDRARILESELVVCKMSLFHYKILFTKTPSMDGCSTVMLKVDGWDWIDHLVG